MDIPEFYELVKELFSPEEAAVFNAIPEGFHPAATIAGELGKSEEEVTLTLEAMADKGLCSAGKRGDTPFYGTLPFVPGIFEFQLMRGTRTERDKKLAKLMHKYTTAVDALKGPPEEVYPTYRVIPVRRTIQADNTIHTYLEVAKYIEKYDPLSVSTCFCRHEAKLIDENDDCGKPDDVCMQFGRGAQFVIDRGMGRRISKDEAMRILKQAEAAGLVHCSMNRQEIDFLCNCCHDHCMILKTALAHPKPGLACNSGFKPVLNADLCTACESCIDRCPMDAVALGADDVPEVDLDRCIGCGVCATGCPEQAIELVEREGIPAPPVDHKALVAAIKQAAQAE
jgi:Pyruvate/2-oxoacid:ferredoxin oxidoreductase delta subunit